MSKKKRSGTRLVEKHFSPLIVRRYTHHTGWPVIVAIITDSDLNDLDDCVSSFVKMNPVTEELQEVRNWCGALVECISLNYDKCEGVAVIGCFDKCIVSSLSGDFMTHTQCRLELFSLLNMSCHV